MNNLSQAITFEISSRLQGSISPRLQQKIAYIHIPKCGGVSLSKAIKACYVNWNVRDESLYKLDSEAAQRAMETVENQPLTTHDSRVVSFRQNLLLYGMAQPQVKYISGHFLFSNVAYDAFKDQYAFVTMLRDPVKRWISAYFYNRYKDYGNSKIELDIDTYLESDIARRSGQTYARYLCGLTDYQGDYSSDEIIQKAQENLTKFTVVGCIERKDLFETEFSKAFGQPLKLGKWNKSPKNKDYQKSLITDDMMDKIRQLCKSDIEIYNYAMRHLIERH